MIFGTVAHGKEFATALSKWVRNRPPISRRSASPVQQSTWESALAVQPLRKLMTTFLPILLQWLDSKLNLPKLQHMSITSLKIRIFSSALQVMAAHGAHGKLKRRVGSYEQYKYNDDLSEELLVIDNMSKMTSWVKDCYLLSIRAQW